MSGITRYLSLADGAAVAVSIICAFHCMLLPVFVLASPTIAATIFGQESFHQILVFLIIPISLYGLILGCRRHKHNIIKYFGFGGLGVLVLAATVGHDVFGEMGEKFLTLLGSVLIALVHIRNHLLCHKFESRNVED